MGPQSSGKSTLLNTLFGTSFVMMDDMGGRTQTTQARAPHGTAHRVRDPQLSRCRSRKVRFA